MSSTVREPSARQEGHETSGDRWAGWAGLAARVGLAGVLLVAGLLKITDLTATVQNVLAYELFPYDLARLIAITLPVLEITLGLLLLTGLLTRPAAMAAGLLMVVFMAGIVSAWARGLSIDCGCFSKGGRIDADQTTYTLDLARDIFFLSLAVWLMVRPRTPFALDHLRTKGS